MERIAKGEARDIESLLHGVQRLVMEDLETMKNNAPGMRKALGVSTEAPPPKDKVTGVWNGKEVSFNAEWSGHRFSKDEIAALLAGAEISFEAWSKRGKPYIAKGKLAKQKYNGRTFVGFKPDFGKK